MSGCLRVGSRDDRDNDLPHVVAPIRCPYTRADCARHGAKCSGLCSRRDWPYANKVHVRTGCFPEREA